MDVRPKSFEFKRLPILAVLYEALWYVWSLRRQIGLAILIPVCASTLVYVGFYAGVLPPIKLIGWGVWAVNAVSWSFAAVACHRLVLLGPGSVAKFGVNGKSAREWKFLLLFAAVSAITVVLVMLLAFVLQGGQLFVEPGGRQGMNALEALGSFLSVPAYLLLLASIAPLSLVLPAAATDGKLDFFGAFRLAAGNRWRLAVLLVVMPIFLGILSKVFDPTAVGITYVLAALFRWLLVPCEVAVLSICYKRLSEPMPKPPSTTASPPPA